MQGTNGILTIKDSVIADNTAVRGGGISPDFAFLTIQGSIFKDNVAEESGNDIYDAKSPTVVCSDSSCSAGQYGNCTKIAGAFPVLGYCESCVPNDCISCPVSLTLTLTLT